MENGTSRYGSGIVGYSETNSEKHLGLGNGVTDKVDNGMGSENPRELLAARY
jgi:hypothetical protein